MKDSQLVNLFQQARRSHVLATIEGVQAVKHAARFGAKFDHIITCDIKSVRELLDGLAPDISQKVLGQIEEVREATFQKLSPQPPRTKIIALAQRRAYSFKDINNDRPILFLEAPRDLENIGAVIRVAAAADASAVVTSGPLDIWNPAVIRGAAGLHFALPVFNAELNVIAEGRAVIALDPDGADITDNSITPKSVLIFGTERLGISQALLKKSDQILRLPMKAGVSSLNLATSVAATLYRMG